VARTLADLRAEVLGTDFDSATYSSLATTYLNQGVRRIGRKVRAPALETTQTYTTSAGSATLALPTDDVRVVSLRNTTDHDFLQNVDVGEIDDSPAASGKPYAYTIYGGAVTLYPTPDAAYSLELRYRKVFGQFVNDTDTTATISFPGGDDYADALIAYARWHLYLKEDDAGMAQVWKGEYKEALDELKADVQLQSEDAPRQVPSMWDVGDPPPLTWRS
jgi:hypothetical protein